MQGGKIKSLERRDWEGLEDAPKGRGAKSRAEGKKEEESAS